MPAITNTGGEKFVVGLTGLGTSCAALLLAAGVLVPATASAANRFSIPELVYQFSVGTELVVFPLVAGMAALTVAGRHMAARRLRALIEEQ